MTDTPSVSVGRPLTTPPRASGHWLFGSALDLQRSQITTYERTMRQVGDVVLLTVGPPGLRFDMYCVFHPDGVRRVLTGARTGYTKDNRFYRQIADVVRLGAADQ